MVTSFPYFLYIFPYFLDTGCHVGDIAKNVGKQAIIEERDAEDTSLVNERGEGEAEGIEQLKISVRIEMEPMTLFKDNTPRKQLAELNLFKVIEAPP